MKKKTDQDWYNLGKQTGAEVYKVSLLKYLESTAITSYPNKPLKERTKNDLLYKKWKGLMLNLIKNYEHTTRIPTRPAQPKGL